MRVSLGTNVLVSAFATRGLCADVLRVVLADHELVVGEVVLAELRKVLRGRLRVPARIVDDVERLLREHDVVPKPREPAAVPVRDPSDRWILASAIAGKADVLVTGDRDLLEIETTPPPTILDPRGFWTLARRGRHGR